MKSVLFIAKLTQFLSRPSQMNEDGLGPKLLAESDWLKTLKLGGLQKGRSESKKAIHFLLNPYP